MIFLDTGALIAFFDEADPFRASALEGFDKLERSSERAFTTPLIVAETLAALAQDTGDFRRTAHIGLNLLEWEVEIVRPTPVDERRALVLMESYAEKRVGYVDCLSFVVMDARGSRTAFTFDETHFVKVRKLKPWVPIPEKKAP